jgi:hypothetical protein
VTTPTVDDQPPARSRLGRNAALVAVVLMVGMWCYVLYLAFGPGRQPSPDRLADPAFAEQAEARCHEAGEQVLALPAAAESATATDRAEVLDQANAIYGMMLDDLVRIAPSGDDGTITREWIADWRTYLGDRADFAKRLRTDPKARLLVTPKQGEQITEFIDQFAKDNRMTACGTPADV